MVNSVEQKKRNIAIIEVDGGEPKAHASEVVSQNLEETQNALLMRKVFPAQCNADRSSTQEGHYQRSFQTTSGQLQLRVPKLRHVHFEAAIIKRYCSSKSSMEKALVEMYLAGVRVRKVTDITEVLWGSRVSPSTISDLNQKIFERVEAWRQRPLEWGYAYVFVDVIWLRRAWSSEVATVSVLVATGVKREGYREVFGVVEGSREDRENWRGFLPYLKGRGLERIRLLFSD